MTSPQRLSVKIFASPDPGAAAKLAPIIPLFHKFIQNGSVAGVLLDVADYAHVPDGPGVILIGLDVDYGLDLRDGRAGLLVTNKRRDGELAELTEQTLRMALGAVVAMEADGSSGFSFATDKLELHVTDRLGVPNDAATFEAIAKGVQPIAEKLYGAGSVELIRLHADDPRRGLAIEFAAPGAADAKALLDRLGGPLPAAAKRPLQQSEWDISVEELARMRNEGEDFVLVDVREPNEFETCNLGGLLIPLGTIGEGMKQLDKDAHVVVHCKSGARSAKATEALRAAGFGNAWNVAGGILAWSDRVDPKVPKY